MLRGIVGGRKWVVVGGTVAGASPQVRSLRSLDAERCLVAAFARGAGTIPLTEDAEHILIEGPEPATMVAEFRRQERFLNVPSANFLEAADRYDPDRTALILPPPIMLAVPPKLVAGRPVFGRRTESSLQFEDKVRIDAFWDLIGVPRLPSKVVPLSSLSLRGAAESLDRGAGTVWSGDARSGVHAGAELTRWVRDHDDIDPTLRTMEQYCDSVRIAPFVEGIPCSIHGLVFRDYVAALRPVEMLTLRSGSTLRFCGSATWWDPAPLDRDEMRELGRHVGRELRERIGFSGAFTIDGIMSSTGFVPTELNTRYGAGLRVIEESIPELPVMLLCQALLEKTEIDWRPRELEALILEAVESRRSGGAWLQVRRPWNGPPQQRPIGRVSGKWELVQADQEPDAVLEGGPAPLGTFIRLTLKPNRRRAGVPLGPDVAGALTLADSLWALNLGVLAPAAIAR